MHQKQIYGLGSFVAVRLGNDFSVEEKTDFDAIMEAQEKRLV